MVNYWKFSAIWCWCTDPGCTPFRLYHYLAPKCDLQQYRSCGNLTVQNKILDLDSFFRLKILLAMDISTIVFHVNVVVSYTSRDIGHILDLVTRLKKLRVSYIITTIVTKCVNFDLSKLTLLLYYVHVGLYTFESWIAPGWIRWIGIRQIVHWDRATKYPSFHWLEAHHAIGPIFFFISYKIYVYDSYIYMNSIVKLRLYV